MSASNLSNLSFNAATQSAALTPTNNTEIMHFNDETMLQLLLPYALGAITGQPGNGIIICRVWFRQATCSLVCGQDSTMCDVVWVSLQEHWSESESFHFFLQALQWPCPVRKRFRSDHCCRWRAKPGCQIVGLSTRCALTTEADFQDSLHWLLMFQWWRTTISHADIASKSAEPTKTYL